MRSSGGGQNKGGAHVEAQSGAARASYQRVDRALTRSKTHYTRIRHNTAHSRTRRSEFSRRVLRCPYDGAQARHRAGRPAHAHDLQ